MSDKGFGVELADKVFPNKETVSKPVKPGSEGAVAKGLIEVAPGDGFPEGGFGVEVVKGYVGFDKLAKETSPAVAASIGRKKYGDKEFDTMSTEGRTAPEQQEHLREAGRKKESKAFGRKIKGK